VEGAAPVTDRITHKATRWLQVEISSLCQAGCIDCNRWRPEGGSEEWRPGDETRWLQNSHHHMLNKYYPSQDWSKHIRMFEGVRHLQFCGNMGDPMSHPGILDCCMAVKSHMPDCVIDISTNGGIGRPEHYRQLAMMGVHVTFAVDGLEDTNHIYRRGVDWQMVRDRMTAFIDAGGRAQWQWIEFPHNSHQIDRARELSDLWGFDEFEVRTRFTQDSDFDRSILAASKQAVLLNSKHREPDYSEQYLESMYEEQLEQHSHLRVDPACTHAPDVDYHHPNPHINVDGTLWPCCFTANTPFHTSAPVRHWWKRLTQDLDPDWNSLYHHTPQQIIQSEFWQNLLPKTWEDNTNTVCLIHCGKCKA